MVNNLEHGYMPLPNYLAKTLASVARFHDPVDPQGLQYRSRSNSTDNLTEDLRSTALSHSKSSATISEPNSESGSASPTFPKPKVNTVNMIKQSGPNAIQKVSVQLPSLITPVSLYGKRIRLIVFLASVNSFNLVTHIYPESRYSILEYEPLLDSCNMTMEGMWRTFQSFSHFSVIYSSQS